MSIPLPKAASERSSAKVPVWSVAENLILPPSVPTSPFNVKDVTTQSLKAKSVLLKGETIISESKVPAWLESVLPTDCTAALDANE